MFAHDSVCGSHDLIMNLETFFGNLDMSMHENHNSGNPDGLIKLAPTDLQFSDPKKKEGCSENNRMFSSGYSNF